MMRKTASMGSTMPQEQAMSNAVESSQDARMESIEEDPPMKPFEEEVLMYDSHDLEGRDEQVQIVDCAPANMPESEKQELQDAAISKDRIVVSPPIPKTL